MLDQEFIERSNTMNHDNRVLSRKGAREITNEELEAVSGSGAFGTSLLKDGATTTVCSFAVQSAQPPQSDGDCD
jgi:hypothetical protein